MTKGFAGEFAAGVGGDGGKDGISLCEGHFDIHTIDGGGGGDGDFFDAIRTGGFEQVDGSTNIDLLEHGGFEQAGADSGARGEVDDLIELHGAEKIGEGLFITQIAFDKMEWLVQRGKVRQRGAFDGGIVEWRKVVKRPHRMA